MAFWEVSSLGSEVLQQGSDKFVLYKYLLQDESRSWTIEKRYKEFDELNEKLKEMLGESQMPPFPPKHFFSLFVNTDPEFIRERALGIEKYLRGLLKSNSITSQCGDVLDFLDPKRKSTLHTNETLVAPDKNPIMPLPSIPPRLFILNPECIVLDDGEECFLPQFFDHISDSLKYLVQVDHKINDARSAQAKMGIFEVEKDRIKATINNLASQQKVANLIIQFATATYKLPAASAPASAPLNYSENNNYSNVYNNTYNSNNNSNNTNNNNTQYRPPQAFIPPPHPHPYANPSRYSSPNYPNPNYRTVPVGYSTVPYGAPLPYGPPPPYRPPIPSAPLQPSVNNLPPAPASPPLTQTNPNDEGRAILSSYVELCLKHIQDAIIWESGLEGSLLVSCVDEVSGFCEVQERLKWFSAEADKLIVGTLGVSLAKDAKKDLNKKIKELLDMAVKYHGEIVDSLKHKCTLSELAADHLSDCRVQLKKTIDFIEENKVRVGAGPSSAESVDAYEATMFALLEEIAQMETASYNTPEERKMYSDKSVVVRKKISALMKDASEFKVDLIEEKEKLAKASLTNSQNGTQTDETTLNSLINRLEDLQENLADLQHDFSKALEFAKRDGLGGVLKEKQLDNARKKHEKQEENMFDL